MNNPFEYFNELGVFKDIFEGDKSVSSLTDTEYKGTDTSTMETGLIFRDIPPTPTTGGYVEVFKNNAWKIPLGKTSRFTLLAQIRFKGDWQAAVSYVWYYLMKVRPEYIRVKTDYYKIIQKTDSRYNIKGTFMIPWKKEEIKEDHGKEILKLITKYNDFVLFPNNKNHIDTKDNCFNVYSKFPHVAYEDKVTEAEIPTSIMFLKHIFGEDFDKLELGLRYMKVLYLHPTEILPILVLVSTERETGKTTFIDWIKNIFGENAATISPTYLTSDFNSLYANKNIIMIDEPSIEKSATVEKVKALVTAKTVTVNQKFVQGYSIPFFGKIIMGTNKESDFMRIDNEEIRFWVRKIKKITGKKNNRIDYDLVNEIPKFLKYLEQLPEIELNTGSRMIFTSDEIETEALQVVKKESKSSLCKEMEEHIMQNCIDLQINKFYAIPLEIKKKWFPHNSNVSAAYIRKVLEKEMNLSPSKKQIRYDAFGVVSNNPFERSNGWPFLFEVEGDITIQEEKVEPQTQAPTEKINNEFQGDLPF